MNYNSEEWLSIRVNADKLIYCKTRTLSRWKLDVPVSFRWAMEVFFEEGPSVSFSIEKFSRNSADRGKFLETGTKLKSKNRSARVKGSVCSLPTNCADIFQGKIPILPIPISRPNSAQWQFRPIGNFSRRKQNWSKNGSADRRMIFPFLLDEL